MASMSVLTPSPKPEVIYPESDGLPLSDNTRQFRWIMTIQGGLDAQYLNDENVFVAGNLLWYPVEGDNKLRGAPDAFVVFGRPKGDRGSYQQWREDNIAPQVVFEVLSPSDRANILIAKFRFYEKYGVEEYYVYDPDANTLGGWQRINDRLEEVPSMAGWISPLLGITFDMSGEELRILGKNGEVFVPTTEAIRQRDEAVLQRDEAVRNLDEARRQAEKLAAQLKSLGIEPEA